MSNNTVRFLSAIDDFSEFDFTDTHAVSMSVGFNDDFDIDDSEYFSISMAEV